MSVYYAVVTKDGAVSKGYRAGTKLYQMKHAAQRRARFMKGSYVAVIHPDELEPLTESADLTEQYAHAERMMLKYAAKADELKKAMYDE